MDCVTHTRPPHLHRLLQLLGGSLQASPPLTWIGRMVVSSHGFAHLPCSTAWHDVSGRIEGVSWSVSPNASRPSSVLSAKEGHRGRQSRSFKGPGYREPSSIWWGIVQSSTDHWCVNVVGSEREDHSE